MSSSTLGKLPKSFLPWSVCLAESIMIKVTPRKLGLILRAHRAELSGLVGDGADTAWPARFLEKVDRLLAPKTAAASLAETESAG